MATKRQYCRKASSFRWYWIYTTMSTLHIIIIGTTKSIRSSSCSTATNTRGNSSNIAVMAAFHPPPPPPMPHVSRPLDTPSSPLVSTLTFPSLSSSSSSTSRLLQAMSSEDIKARQYEKSPKEDGIRRRVRKKSSLSSASSSNETEENAFLASSSRAGPLHGNNRVNRHDNNNEDEEEEEVDDDELPVLSSKGMARLSRAVAKASAEREALKIARNGNSSNSSGGGGRNSNGWNNNGKILSNNNNNSSNNIHNNINNVSQSPKGSLEYRKNLNGKIKTATETKSLSQLTRVIDSQLYANGPRGTNRGDYPKIEGVVQNARDHMISLLGFNQVQGDWKMHSSTSTFNVAVVFGKELVRDQVTVEYASRIRTLARLFKEEPEFRPKLVCFCGGIAGGSHVANSDAGYIFFRHMCEAQGIDLDGVSIYIDNSSKNDAEAVGHVTEEVKKRYIPKWLEDSPETTDLMQKMIDVHFTLVSTEYHLCNMNDVHHRSPEQSLLKEMENMGLEFLDRPRRTSFDRASSGGGGSRRYAASGLVKTSWSFQYATYPYIYAKNDLVAFLGKCYLLAEELVPLLVNMKAVVDQKEFFQRDNYLILASIRRSLVEEIETLHKPSHSRKKTLNNELRRLKDMYGNERDVISILEGALLSLGRCVDLVKPAGLHTGSVSKDDWKKALKALEHSMSEIRSYCDPDRPLMPSEWGKLVDDDSIASKRTY